MESEIVPADEAAAISGLALVNVGTGTCVTLEGPRQEQPGEQLLTQQDCVGSPEQTWMFDDQGRLRNSTELDDLVESCVTMPDLDAQPVVVTQMVCDGSDRQAWLAQALGDGTFVIQSVSDPALCIDGFSQDGVTLTATPCQTESGGTPGQAFDLVSLDTPTGEALIADDPAVADAAVDVATEDPFADGPLSDEPSTEEMLLDGAPVEETPVDAAISGNSFVTLADLEGRVVKILDHERGAPALLVRNGVLLHIPSADDYWRCLETSKEQTGLDVVHLLAAEVAATDWPIDWRYQERCPGAVSRISPTSFEDRGR